MSPPLPARFSCPCCGSRDVRADASVAWDVHSQTWVIMSIFDDRSCESCGQDGIKALIEEPIEEPIGS